MIVIHTQQKQIANPDVIINNLHVEIVYDIKVLGITINKHLKWHTHIDNMSLKVSTYIGVINRLKCTLPPRILSTLYPRILSTLYNSLILPLFNYGLLMWGSGATILHKFQKRALRNITNSKYNSHTEPVCKLLYILKLPDLY